MKVKLNISEAFKNKTNLTGEKHAFSFSFYPVEIELADLANHITAGGAWTLGEFRSNQRNKKSFVSSQFLALDFDSGTVSVDSALENEFIGKHAFLIHPSASSTPSLPKTRVIFVLSEVVDDLVRWEALQKALLEYFGDLKPDIACKDASRLFYGSDKDGAVLNGAQLDINYAGGLCVNAAWAEMAYATAPPKQVDPESFSGRHFLEVHQEVEKLLGHKPSDKLDSDGFYFERTVCPFHNHEHDNTDPAFTYKPSIYAGHCHKTNTTYNLFAIARQLGVKVDSYRNRQNMHPEIKNALPEATQSFKDIIAKSQKNLEKAASYFDAMYNVRPYISRQRMVGALNMRITVAGYPIDFIRYVIPNYFQDAVFGAKIRLDIHSVRKAWWKFEEENPKAFKSIYIPYPDDSNEYWNHVYTTYFGGVHGYLETDRLYNLSACLEPLPEGKIRPRRVPHLLIVAANVETDVLALLSAGYCATGASLEETANLNWLFSRAEHHLVIAHESQKALAQRVCSKSGVKQFCLIPDNPGTMLRMGSLETYMTKYDVYPIERK